MQKSKVNTMAKEKTIQPSKEFIESANLTLKEYQKLYNESIKSPQTFWKKQAERLTWFNPPKKILSENFGEGKVKWFDTTKGYGFIAPDDGSEDIFVHISEVESAGYTSLTKNQAIGYDLYTKNGKSYAIKLQLI